jgi:hypothetical protein
VPIRSLLVVPRSTESMELFEPWAFRNRRGKKTRVRSDGIQARSRLVN